MKTFSTVVLASLTLSAAAFASTALVAPVGESDGIRPNADGTFTILNPRMLRGREKLRIHTGGQGACALFGFRVFKSSEDDRLEQQIVAVELNSRGEYVKRIDSTSPYKEVRCAWKIGENGDALRHTSQTITNNPDNSVTILNPRYAYEGQLYSIHTGGRGACIAYGYDSFLISTDASLPQQQDAVSLSDSGSFQRTIQSHNPYETVTCYNEGTLRTAVQAGRIYRNPDDSYTIENPKLLYGNREARIHTTESGVCKLFGFSHYLADTAKDGSFTRTEEGVVVDTNGVFQRWISTTNPYIEVTCHNETAPSRTGPTTGTVQVFEGEPDPEYFKRMGRDLQKLAR